MEGCDEGEEIIVSYGERSCVHFGRCAFDEGKAGMSMCNRLCSHYERGDPERKAKDDAAIAALFSAPAEVPKIYAHPRVVSEIKKVHTPGQRCKFRPPMRRR